MSRIPQIKNRAPAPIQITAEQLLREAKERQLEDAPRAPKQHITDKEELQLYRQNKRKDYEDQIRRQRFHIGTWTKYALWEATQKEFERSRSVFERALDVDYRNQALWLKYAEMEMKNKFINHARNVWDRAVTLHPRVDMFWYKYSYMEEMIGAIDNARQVFERWMKWEPDDMGWAAYIKFEMRQGDIIRSRAIYERYVALYPTCRAYLKYAKWEEKQHQKGLSRKIYERAMDELHPQERSEKLLINFARFEERCKEFDRARVIFKFALSQLSQDSAPELYQEFLSFEKRHGTRGGIEEAILNKRRQTYEEEVVKDKFNYDAWFDYCRLEQDEGDVDKIRAIYDRAVANHPPLLEKRYWRRYIYLWVYYGMFEELRAKDVDRAREVYKRCLDVIPHRRFTFGKIWLYAALLEVRQKDLNTARKILGQGIGMCGKENIFKGYIELELQLGEVERCRAIYVKYLETMPFNCSAWKSFAALEAKVGEELRARAVYELAVAQSELDMPEALWKAYIDFEIDTVRVCLQTTQVNDADTENNNTETDTAVEGYLEGMSRIRSLYERLLEKTDHVKVWISYGQFESSWLPTNCEKREDGGTTIPPVSTKDIITSVRDVYKRGYAVLRDQGLKEERVMLLQSWREAEVQAGNEVTVSIAINTDTIIQLLISTTGHPQTVEAMMPHKVKMKRAVPMAAETETDGEGVMEEYFDYSFPDDVKPIVGIKILEQAMKWKQMIAMGTAGKGSAGKTEAEVDEGNGEGDGEGEGEGDQEQERTQLLGKRKAEEEIDIDDVESDNE
eukprot:gene6973-14171_t